MELPVPNCPKVNCDDLLSETINNGFNQRIRQPMIQARFVYTNCFVQQTIEKNLGIQASRESVAVVIYPLAFFGWLFSPWLQALILTRRLPSLFRHQ